MKQRQPSTTALEAALRPVSGQKTATGVFDTWSGANLWGKQTVTTELRWGVRYSQSDPMGLSGGINLFGYVHGNPLGATDSMGLADDNSPWDTGWEWLTGKGPRDHYFTDGDQFTELLRQHPFIKGLRDKVCNGLVDLEGSDRYSLSGWAGVPKYLRDYSSLGTFGLTGNLAVTYLGSFDVEYWVNGDTLTITVYNESTINSAIHPPLFGYSEWWNNNIGDPLNDYFSSGPMSETRQHFTFNESLCGCPVVASQ